MESRPKKPTVSINTASPVRNFTISLGDQVRGAGGPPAYVERLKSIEDLEARFIDRVADALLEGEEEARRVVHTLDLSRLNKLIESHNRWYPTEANLPIDPHGGGYLLWGEPWAPHPLWTAERLLSAARKAE